MDAFLQRMIQRFHDQVYQRMPPERKARKLAVMKALATSIRNKENDAPINNNNMSLQSNFTYSTPVKNLQVTDLDDLGSEMEMKTDLRELEFFNSEGKNEESYWRNQEEPISVIAQIHDLTNDLKCVDSINSSGSLGDDSVETSFIASELTKLGDRTDKHWRSLEILHETAEYEFYRSLEESKLFVSTASLLEEIEAELPSPYSLAKPLNHTFHTLTSYRTQERLARMDANPKCQEILKKTESLKIKISSKKMDQLEIEATVQKALAEQAGKALILSKANKFFGDHHIESEKALLLANLRFNAVVEEAKKLRMLGETPEKECFGQITISDMYFEVNHYKDNLPEKYISTATEREHVQHTSIVGEVIDGKLHFSDQLKFSNLSKDFVIYVDLYKLLYKEPKKALMATALLKKLKRITAINLNKSLTNSSYSRGGFVCVAQCELRLENVVHREKDICLLQNYLTNLQHSVVGKDINLLVKTDLNIKSKQSGFLNVFKKTWHRQWYLQSGYFLGSWLYPEDQESDKTPVDSIYLPNCSSIEAVGLEICIRPHSFVIKLKENNEEILFSANSHKDMVTWIDHLNLILQQIHLWKPRV